MNKPSISLLVALLFAAPAGAVESADAVRLDDVAERGRHVMPFDLEKTTHVFAKTEDGGRQQVIARNPADAEQIRLIREHLKKIAAEFSQGDFSGPARIHGEDMPGLAALKNAKSGRIEYRYQELPDGAQIDYVTADADLIEAIHRYFDAQLSDHARHAVPGHEMHHRLHSK
jgi:hypothetical protein